jgi:hypothetical protein
MDQIPEMCVMTRLIWSQCVQTLVRRNTMESSRNLKHIKVNPVPGENEIFARFGPDSRSIRAD